MREILGKIQRNLENISGKKILLKKKKRRKMRTSKREILEKSEVGMYEKLW